MQDIKDVLGFCIFGYARLPPFLLVVSIFAPGCVRATHPATVEVYVSVLTIEEGVCEVAFFPVVGFTHFRVQFLHEVVDDGGAIVEVYVWELFRVDISLVFYEFSLRASA